MARNLATGESVGEDGWIDSGTKGTITSIRLRRQEARAFLVFIGPNGEVGRLDWETGQLMFSGNMAGSARIFFENYLKPYVEAAIKEGLCKRRP